MTIRSKQKLNYSNHKPFEIVLVNPEIPPNTGNIARLCAATGSKLHLIHPLGYKIDDKNLKRAGLDYWNLLDIEEHKSWEDFTAKYNSSNSARFWLISTRGEKNIWEIDFQEGDFLIFGSETTGLSEDILNQYHNKDIASIPMNGQTRSLNLSTAVGIVLYEGLRQLTVEKRLFKIVPV